METIEKKEGLNAPKNELNYVIIDGKKHSRTWSAMQKLKGGKILDMGAVLK
mgnify:FL=1